MEQWNSSGTEWNSDPSPIHLADALGTEGAGALVAALYSSEAASIQTKQ